MGLITPNDFPNSRELYIGQLRYLLSTENQIVSGLPTMIISGVACHARAV